MNHYLMIAGFFIIVTIAVASLEPFAPSLPSGPQDVTTAGQDGQVAGQDDQVADSGDVETDEADDSSNVPTASPGMYDEAAEDRGK